MDGRHELRLVYQVQGSRDVVAVYERVDKVVIPGGWRAMLRRIGPLRSAYYLILAMRDAFVESPERVKSGLELEFERGPDPWQYETEKGQRRLRHAAETLDSVRRGARFGAALEIGCAEGAFTAMLAPRCDSVLAVDSSPLALDRARARTGWDGRVRFQRWDLRQDPLPGIFDLIVLTSVLEYFGNPGSLRAACAKVIAGLNPGGLLLVGNMRQNEVSEDAWWGRVLIRGGKWIDRYMAGQPGLEVITTTVTDSYIESLLRKVK